MCVQNKYQYFFMITKHLIDVWIGWFRWHFAYKAKGLERAAHFYAYQIDTINNVIKSYLQNKSIFSYYYLWVLCVCVSINLFKITMEKSGLQKHRCQKIDENRSKRKNVLIFRLTTTKAGTQKKLSIPSEHLFRLTLVYVIELLPCTRIFNKDEKKANKLRLNNSTICYRFHGFESHPSSLSVSNFFVFRWKIRFTIHGDESNYN